MGGHEFLAADRAVAVGIEPREDRLAALAPLIEAVCAHRHAGALSLRLGDEPVAIQGVRYRHGRSTPNPNRWSAHLFMHWVDRDGPYRAHAFDAERLAAEAKAQETRAAAGGA